MDIAKIFKDIDLRMNEIGYDSLFISFMPTEIWSSDPRIRLDRINFCEGKPYSCFIAASNRVIFEPQSTGIIRAENFFRYLKVE